MVTARATGIGQPLTPAGPASLVLGELPGGPVGPDTWGRSALGAGVMRADAGGVNTSTTVEVSRLSLSASELLCVAADPVRWRLLSALAGGTRCVCELQPVAGVTAPALSHHLKVLREAGLVTAARRGRWIDYTLAADAGERLRAALPVPMGDAASGGCCQSPDRVR